jgi:hypothetical protein
VTTKKTAEMAQFDVFVNPISQARRAYPYVAVLQSDLAEAGPERIVAPLCRPPDSAYREMIVAALDYLFLGV